MISKKKEESMVDRHSYYDCNLLWKRLSLLYSGREGVLFIVIFHNYKYL
jgi:hypothetical protein